MSASGWRFSGFEGRFERWVSQEHPTAELRTLVANWIFDHRANPYDGLKRDEINEDLWWARIPHSEDGRGNAVACAYWIDGAARTVRCEMIRSLPDPM